jgi:hypothetical protein
MSSRSALRNAKLRRAGAPRSSTRPYDPIVLVDRLSRTRDLPAVAVWTAVAGVGIVVGGALCARNPEFHTNAAPFHGYWVLVLGPGTLAAVVAGAALVAAGPALADRLPWRRLLTGSAVAAFAWSVALAVSVGGHGFTEPLSSRNEYLAGLRFVDGDFLRTFTDVLPAYPTHIKGHPPGMVLVFWLLDRIGLSGPGWASVLVVAVGASAVPAVLLTVRDVASEATARRLAPFLALAPAAVWTATSGDAFFTGVGAWAVYATVLATSRRRPPVLAGLLWAAVLLLSYGLVLLAPVAIGVAWWRRRIDVLVTTAIVATASLVVLGVATGYWWPDGLAATRRAYLAGAAPGRAAWVFIWLNLCAFAIAVGPAVAPALRRLRASGPALLVGGALAGVVLADLSLMSKAEVERIWLPWVPWVLVATVALPTIHRRRWLTAQAATGIALQLALRSSW